MEPISGKYRNIIIEMLKNSTQKGTVTEKDVFQTANHQNRLFIYQIVEDLLLPGSGILHMENLEKLLSLSKSGKSCLILMEHFSNFDLPCLFYLLEKQGEKGGQIAEAIIAMAGMKLNEEHPVVLAFTEAFTRIVIYPSRSMKTITDQAVYDEEKKKSNAINRAAMHELVRAKNSGHLILVFPAGTRYRPWEPETGRGLKEIDSYIKSFDHMVFISINGNILRINPNQGMHEDLAVKDVVTFNVSPVIDCNDYRNRHKEEAPEGEDPKQYVVDRVMEELSRLHETTEKTRTLHMSGNSGE